MEKFRRRNYFIDKGFQTKFIVEFCVIVIVSSLIVGVSLFYLSTDFTTVAIENAHVIVKRTSDFMMPIVAETLILVTAFSAIAVIILTLFTSHRIAGPLYRLKREIEVFKGGKIDANFKTRSTDQLQDLADALQEMGRVLGAKHREVKEKAAEVKAVLEKMPASDKGAVMQKLGELESAINYFKV